MILLFSLNQQDVEILKKAPTDISAFGVRCLSSYLKSCGEECKIIFLSKKHREFESRRELAEIENFIKKLNPDIIGLSLMSNHYPRAVRITEDIKRYYKKPVVWGGIHPTISSEQCSETADVVFIGEAEHSLLDFYREYKNNVRDFNTRGIVYKKEGQVINNGIYPLCRDLDSLPFWDYDLEDHFVFFNGQLTQINYELLRHFFPFYASHYRIMTTRGCPFNCAYCGSPFLKDMYEGKFLRIRSVDNVIEELKLAKKRFPYLKLIKIMDDCFSINPIEWLREFAEKYKKEINLAFYCLVNPITISEEKLNILTDAGLKTVQMGLQTGSDRVNRDVYKRYISNEQFSQAVSLLDKFRAQISFSFDVIVDNPYEKEEDFIETAKLLNQISRPFRLTIFSLCFYPGTEIYHQAERDGFSKEKLNEYITKQFHLAANTYFNKLFRMIPILNKNQVNDFIQNRHKLICRKRLDLYYFLYIHRDFLPLGFKSFLKKIAGM